MSLHCINEQKRQLEQLEQRIDVIINTERTQSEHGEQMMSDEQQLQLPMFPCTNEQCLDCREGVSIQEYAAIHLCVPNSGNIALDDMIRQARRDKFIVACLADTAGLEDSEESIVMMAKNIVDQLLTVV
jgi:hypothetical protein